MTVKTRADLKASMDTDLVDNPGFAGIPVRDYLSLRGAAADLTSGGAAIFTATNKFGE